MANPARLEVPHDIESAASYINNALLSKGYIQNNELLEFMSHQFVTSDDDEAAADDGTGVEQDTDRPKSNSGKLTFDTAVETDRRLLNLINQLLETIDSDATTRDRLAEQTNQAMRARESAELELHRLQTKYRSMETQLSNATRQVQSLETAKRGLENKCKATDDELTKLAHLHQNNKVKFGNELRKRDVALSKLKQRLQDPALRSKPLMGVSGSFSKRLNSFTSGQQPSTGSGGSGATDVSESLLTNFQALSKDNSMLYALCYKTKLVLDNMLSHGFENPQIELSPEELDNIDGLGYDREAGQDENTSPGESTALVPSGSDIAKYSARAINRTTSISHLADETAASLELLSQQIHAMGTGAGGMVPAEELERKEEEARQLKEQVEQATANWKQAVETMENWKKLRNK